MKDNRLADLSMDFAVDVLNLCDKIRGHYSLKNQLERSATSIGANIREANYGQSRADMLSKFEISLKECSETEGWLKLLFNTNVVDENTYKNHRNLCGRIRRLLISSCTTLKEKKLKK